MLNLRIRKAKHFEEMSIFKRKIYEQLLDWKRTKDGKTALLIRGARRVGKSTIAEEFAKNEYESYIIVDFSNATQAVWDAVADVADLDSFFMRLQFIYGVQLKERKSAIIFDEIQKAPLVRQAVKHMVKDHRYDIIETGSLLSIKKNVEGIVIPSEETRINMYPMDYEEFKWALGDTATIPLLEPFFKDKKPLKDSINRKLLRDFRLYMLVGGMPQAVNTYLETNNLAAVDSTKREIIDLYSDDFRKIDPSGAITEIFRAIPSELSKNASRFQISSIIGRGYDKKDLLNALQDMEDSMAVNFAYHANDPSVGLALHKDMQRFKIYTSDTGLFVTLAFRENSVTDNALYQKLLSDKLSADLGYVYENIVAQMLKANGHELFYYTFPTESGKHNYEVDFLLTKNSKLCPIEVKSSGYKAHASLDAFCKKFSDRVHDRYLIYTKDIKKDEHTVMIPVYMTLFL